MMNFGLLRRRISGGKKTYTKIEAETLVSAIISILE